MKRGKLHVGHLQKVGQPLAGGLRGRLCLVAPSGGEGIQHERAIRLVHFGEHHEFLPRTRGTLVERQRFMVSGKRIPPDIHQHDGCGVKSLKLALGREWVDLVEPPVVGIRVHLEGAFQSAVSFAFGRA